LAGGGAMVGAMMLQLVLRAKRSFDLAVERDE